jgi:hypothetical protein
MLSDIKTRWIIVSMYKTKPEDKGWYISDDYKRIFWSLINSKFDIDICSKSTINTFRLNGEYGFVKYLPNIILFDLVKNNIEFNTTKDLELFGNPKFISLIIKGISDFEELTENDNIETRVGLIGRNTAGVILNGKIDKRKIKINELKKIRLKKTGYGLMQTKDFGVYKNTSFYFLENITSRYYKINNKEMLGWSKFFE